ncbi:MAG: CBS domain-containing protein [Aminobacterium sp.]|uniref:CBS domain-containing protein n=1 Tax=Aminobacterium sp. TaxID=1872491 RepID=UPI002B207A37|nr:CBS domain-containing protein [Aminobacterium sp.]MEA4878216.1 CBS domain-containing protein [Aminobacterium sp.]
MKIITSHMGNDFDSIASMVAASKLYPDAVLSLSGSTSRTVRDFLRKFPQRWPIVTPRKVRKDEVTQLIVVDTRSRSRIGPFATLLGRHDVSVHVYDHHPPSSDDIDGELMVIDPVGATTTLLVEILLQRHIHVTPHEATLFAMGIYEDTGGLTFGGTTVRDFTAISNLKELGADLTIIPAHIEMSFSASERRILDLLIENAWVRYINGARVVLSYTASSVYVDGLSLFVHRLRDYFTADIALAAVRMEKRTYVVARSHENILDVSKFLAHLGGGGHPQASSVTLHNVRPLSILETLEKKLEESIQPRLKVEDIMTSPVMAVEPDSSVNDAYRTMIRYGHSALPVVFAGRVRGIITRKDLDKAQLHGFGLALVKEFMTESVISVAKEASISEAHRILVFHNIGRLPVLDGKELVGIITRTDLVRALYPESLPPEERKIAPELPWSDNLELLLQKKLKPRQLEVLTYLGERAEALGMKAYIVGGIVRDLMLGRESLDLDVVVEGNAVDFLKSLKQEDCHISVHERYKTGTLVFGDGVKVDVATARREFYEYPLAQPKVSSDSLKHDLYRRDFTINAMAISITPSTWGTLVDYFGGRRDLKKKTLKVLHNLSFVEDSTRVIRGIRLEQRLNFHIEDNTLRLLTSCLRGGLLSRLSGYRLRSELELTMQEKNPYPALKRMSELSVWDILFPGIRIGKTTMRTIRRLSAFLARISRDFPDFKGDEWLAFLAALAMESDETIQSSVLDRLSLAPREREIMVQSLDGLGAAEQDLGGRIPKKNSEIYHYFYEVSPVTALFWSAATERWRVRRRILSFLTKLHKTKSYLTGRDLIQMGYRGGPQLGQILSQLRDRCLDEELTSQEEELAWVQRNFPIKGV